MPNSLIPYQSLREILSGLDEQALVEFEILAGRRLKYRDELFNLDAVIGLAKDLYLIEYRVTYSPLKVGGLSVQNSPDHEAA